MAAPTTRPRRAHPPGISRNPLAQIWRWVNDNGLEPGPLHATLLVDEAKSIGRVQLHATKCFCQPADATRRTLTYAELITSGRLANCLDEVPTPDPEVSWTLTAAKRFTYLTERVDFERWSDYRKVVALRGLIETADIDELPTCWHSHAQRYVEKLTAELDGIEHQLGAEPRHRLAIIAASLPDAGYDVHALCAEAGLEPRCARRLLDGTELGYGPERQLATLHQSEPTSPTETLETFAAASQQAIERHATPLADGPDIAVAADLRWESWQLLATTWPTLLVTGHVAVLRMPEAAAGQMLTTGPAAVVPVSPDELGRSGRPAEVLQIAMTLWRSGPTYRQFEAAWQAADALVS